MNRDVATYGPDASLFNPSRHLDAETGSLKPALADTHDESHVSYGFGRRICVGRHIANNLLLSQLVIMLWSLRIEGQKDQNGGYVEIDIDGFIDEGLVMLV
jgi:cytochrome P450